MKFIRLQELRILGKLLNVPFIIYGIHFIECSSNHSRYVFIKPQEIAIRLIITHIVLQ